ncbi:hypothetical protein DXG01_015369 [Tephrocybe rancida]|nr:hypothetical protein DXG01_015369 [Tephrocybe rancida]
MKFTSAFVIAALPLAPCFAATITLYNVVPTTTASTPTISLPPASFTIRPIGTGANGETTYAQDSEASVFAEAKLNGGFYTTNGVVTTHDVVTRTYTTGPLTYHVGTKLRHKCTATIVADKTHFVFEQDPVPTGPIEQQGGVKQDCVYDGKSGTCVGEHWQGTETFTETTTWAGTVTPIYTLVVADAAKPTKDNGAASVRGQAFAAWGMFAAGALSAWVLLL